MTEGKHVQTKAVFTIREGNNKDGNGKESYWTRIGVAFVNKDGSYNVNLDALPANGKLHIRDFTKEEKEEKEEKTEKGLGFGQTS